MPFVSNAPDEEKEDQPNASQGPVSTVGGSGAVHLAPAGGVLSTSGGASGGPSTPAPVSGAGSPSATPSGGQFASLGQYLNANQGQAAPLAGKITTGINNQYNNLNNQNTSTLSGINQQVAASAAPSQAQTNATIAQESANPVSFANNPGNVASFQGLLDASYGGPASAESTSGYQSQQNAINSAISAGQNAVGTEAGRENLLSQNEAAPTTGVTALNSAILSQDPNALNSIEKAYQPFNGLLTNLQSGATSTDQQIAAQQAGDTQASQAANAAIANQTRGLNTAVNNQLANANTTNTNFVNDYNSVLGGLNGGTLTDAQMAELGMTPDQYSALQNQVNLAGNSVYETAPNFGAASATTGINNDQYLTQQAAPAAVTANQVATPEQFQTLMALMTLNQNQLPAGAVLDPTAASQAGTYVAPTLNGAFNYNQALQNATTVEQQERAAAQNQASTLSANALAAHNTSKSGGIANSIKNAIAHPIQALALNPLSAPQNIENALQGKVTTGDNPLPGAAGDLGKGFNIGSIENANSSNMAHGGFTTLKDTLDKQEKARLKREGK